MYLVRGKRRGKVMRVGRIDVQGAMCGRVPGAPVPRYYITSLPGLLYNALGTVLYHGPSISSRQASTSKVSRQFIIITTRKAHNISEIQMDGSNRFLIHYRSDDLSYHAWGCSREQQHEPRSIRPNAYPCTSIPVVNLVNHASCF